jgi:hypothetical protein
MDLGRGEGLSGLINMMANGATANTITFAARIYGWGSSFHMPVINRSGRQGRPLVRLEDVGGSVHFEGELQSGAYPLPTNMQHARGTLTLQQNGTANLMSFPVAISNLAVQKKGSRDRPGNDILTVSGDAVKNGTLTCVWGGTQTICSAATLNYAQTDVGLTKIYDPSHLNFGATQRYDVESIVDNDSSEITAIQTFVDNATATPPFSGCKIVSSSFQRTGSGGGVLNIRWGPRSQLDNVLFPKTYSIRSTSDPWIDSSPDVYSYNGSQACQVAQYLFAQHQDGIQGVTGGYLSKLTVRPLSDGKQEAVFLYVQPGIIVQGQTRGNPHQLKAQMNGTEPQLFVTSNMTYGTSTRLIMFSTIESYSTSIRDFSILLPVQGTKVPDSNPSTLNGHTVPFPGQINNADFLGLPQKTVQYKGARYKVNYGLTTNGSFNMFISYQFHYNSAGIIDGVPNQIFSRRNVLDGVTTSEGWVGVHALGMGYIAQPSTASFACFGVAF